MRIDDGIHDAVEQMFEIMYAAGGIGLAALGDPVLGALGAELKADDRTRTWAAIGVALLGDRDRAVTVERSLLARWGERRGDQVRLRVSDNGEEVSEATELLAVLAALAAAMSLLFPTPWPVRIDSMVLLTSCASRVLVITAWLLTAPM